MPKRSRVVVSRKAELMLLRHVQFLANVSIPASRELISAFKEAKRELSEFPLAGPFDEDEALPPKTYRKLLFYGRYKILYEVEPGMVYIDAIVDCRQSLM